MENRTQQPKLGGSLSKRAELISTYLGRIQLALATEMDPERIGLYLEALSDLSERQIQYGFQRAMNECTYIPKIAEIREFANEGAEIFQRLDAENRTKALLSRGSKPDDWSPRLDDIWAELESRAEAQERLDLAYFEPMSDAEIENVMKSGKPYPGKDKYTDWLRRKEARERRAKGTRRPSMRGIYEPVMAGIMASEREPGCDDA